MDLRDTQGKDVRLIKVKSIINIIKILIITIKISCILV